MHICFTCAKELNLEKHTKKGAGLSIHLICLPEPPVYIHEEHSFVCQYVYSQTFITSKRSLKAW